MSFLTGFLATTLARRDPPPVGVDPSLPPAVLVHGLAGSPADMARVSRALRSRGRETFAPVFVPGNGTAPLEDLSVQLAAFIDQHIPADRRPFDLVAHSMGGLVCRHYLQERGGLRHVRSLVTLSSPHRGTVMARLSGACGIRQMRPGSEFLSRLNSAEALATLGQIPVTSLWTPTDLIIVPASSSVVPGFENVPLWGLGHISPVIGPRFIRRILRALEDPPRQSSITDST